MGEREMPILSTGRVACPSCVSLAALALALFAATPARAAFHLWSVNEVYTNSSGTLQFIEMVDNFGGQNFIGGLQIAISDVPGTTTHTYNLPPASLPGSTFGHSLLFGTAGLHAAGGPTPDYII